MRRLNAQSVKIKYERTCRLKYWSDETRMPLYSMPHFNLTMMGLPVKSLKNGFGLTGAYMLKNIYIESDGENNTFGARRVRRKERSGTRRSRM
jgi:hypothetical protein